MTLKDFFDATTRSGNTWAYSEDTLYAVRGQVLQDDKWIDVTWLKTLDGNLFSQHGRAYDIQRRYPVQVVNETANRALDTPFVISTERDARVSYTVRLKADLNLTGTSSSKIDLLVDGVTVGSKKNSLIATLALLTTYSPEINQVLSSTVKAGQTVELKSTVEGTGEAELLYGQEVLL